MSTQHLSLRGVIWPLAGVRAVGLIAACGVGTSSPTSSASAATTPGVLQAEYVKLVQDVTPSVVMVETPTGVGAGIVYGAQGDIVTNNHVVAGAATTGGRLGHGEQHAP